ncbi:MAG: hypothetical protein CFE24_11510 [Flavobacterium sp. BFFFF2]|nr:MAG: hypothetical protein CFE24_11510 [Flavobacterium sp. BFFFF2]
MKKIALLALLGCFQWGVSQKYIDRAGEVRFEASMPALEEVAATNKSASAILNATTGDLAALILVKGFKFKVPLMEEHFNENYVESDKFPKSTFKGKIMNFDPAKHSGKASYDAEGDFTMHGVTKKIKIKVSMTKSDGGFQAQTQFGIKPEDYNIEIPNVVRNKISKSIEITCKFDLKAS